MTRINISVEDFSIEAELNDTVTANKIAENLPLKGSVNVWGEEIYFEIPVAIEQEKSARAEVEVGELGYWPVGSAFCIFFGRTPVSIDERPRAYSPVNIFGKVTGDVTQFKKISNGTKITVKKK